MHKISYFIFSLNVFSNLLVILGSGIFVFTYGPIIYSEIGYRLFKHENNVEVVMDESVDLVTDEIKPDDTYSGIEKVKAINDDFAIIIPKIEVNAPIVEDVSVANSDQYMAALREGVAHAKGTTLPGDEGNMFLFAHSSINFWQLGPYATVFNLLNKLKPEDLVFVVKDSKTYIYKVKSTRIVAGWNTDPFYEEHEGSVLTLITCYPPGTTVNRFVVTAVYIGIQD